MKVLFALGSEQTSKRVAEKYLEKYGDEIEYKNVFYFKALIEEVKKNKTYDRIVISEELEQFELKNIEALDKFIFNNVDNVTDEIEDSEIIFICSDRRSKDHDKFVERLFNIGVYNTLIGDERNITSLCEYIKNPMNKKEAKRHLNINPVVSDGTMSTRDDEVEEAQIMSILKYYDSIKGKREEYLPAFDRIAEQYSRNQLKVILNFLPMDVKSEILSSERYIFLIDSNEYQNMVNNNTQNNPIKQNKRGLFGILKDNKVKEIYRRQPNVIVENNGGGSNNMIKEDEYEKEKARLEKEEEALRKAEEELKMKAEQEAFAKQQEELKNRAIQEAEQREKMEQQSANNRSEFEKQQAELEKLAKQQAMQREQEEMKIKAEQEAFAKQQEELRQKREQEASERAKEEQAKEIENNTEKDIHQSERERLEEESRKIEQEKLALEEARKKLKEQFEQYNRTAAVQMKGNHSGNNGNSNNKKMIVMVGANKSGTTFLANAVSHFLSSNKVTVGLLDITTDNSMYYIYNQNDKGLRKIASECMKKLSEGVDTYIPISNYLKVYTSIPGNSEEKRMYKNRAIIDTARESNDVLIVDADFNAPLEYFEKAKEIYVIQDMDILKMQQTTLFLRELKNRSIDMKKVKIIVNKYVKCMLTPKKIVEGLSYYNDPQMSFIDELLDTRVQYYMIPFNIENYAKYVDCIYKNSVEFKKFTPDFLEAIKEIAQNIYHTGSNAMPVKRRGLFG